MIKQIKTILESCPKNQRKKYLTISHMQLLDSMYPTNDFSYQCFLLLNNLPAPKCPICNKMPNKYKKTCSAECREQYKIQNGNSSMDRMQQTLVEKYGVTNSAKIKSVQVKRLVTMNEKYGANISPKSMTRIKKDAHNLNVKGKETLLRKYGVTNSAQLVDHGRKCKNTMMKHYGTENYYDSNEWKVKSQNNMMRQIETIIPANIKVLQISDPAFKLTQLYSNPNRRIKFTCKKCNTIASLPTETFKYRMRNFLTPCGKCSNINSKGSAAEKEIVEYIKTIYDGKVVENDRSILLPKELDIVLPELNIAIEYCGLYWHNDLRVDKKYHQQKLDACTNKNISLITIFEDEWINKRDIVQNRLKAKLGLNRQKIYARKCVIAEISTATAKMFVDSYHIQGYINCSIRLGLYADKKLVAVMAFAKGNISKGNSAGYELSRFVTIPDTNIVGAAGKLFKYFTRNWQPDIVFSYSDLRWNTGNVYNAIGFTKVSKSRLNYWYILGNKRIHRFNLRKTKADDPSVTEDILRKQQGWLRIWDCGNEKYVWLGKPAQ